MKIRNLIFVVILIVCICACGGRSDAPVDIVRVQQSDKIEQQYDPYVDWNRVNVDREDDDIDFFVQRYGWDVQKTGTGLRIETLSAGIGSLIQPEQVVTLEYTTLLLTGDTIYSSKETGVKKFKVDKSEEPIGLNEAVKMLKKNSKAHIVIPSFLGYGIAGDGDRIKGKVSLAMTIEIIDVE